MPNFKSNVFPLLLRQLLIFMSRRNGWLKSIPTWCFHLELEGGWRRATKFSVASFLYPLRVWLDFQVHVRYCLEIRSMEVMHVRLWPSPGPTVFERLFWNFACGVSRRRMDCNNMHCISRFLIWWPMSHRSSWPLHWNTMEKSGKAIKSGHNCPIVLQLSR